MKIQENNLLSDKGIVKLQKLRKSIYNELKVPKKKSMNTRIGIYLKNMPMESL